MLLRSRAKLFKNIKDQCLPVARSSFFQKSFNPFLDDAG